MIKINPKYNKNNNRLPQILKFEVKKNFTNAKAYIGKVIHFKFTPKVTELV